MYVARTYAYVANGPEGLAIVDVENPERPHLDQIQPHEYAPHDIIRRVQERGRVSMFGHITRVPRVLRGKDIAFRPTSREGHFEVYFRCQKITTAKLHSARERGASAVEPSAPVPADRDQGQITAGPEIVRVRNWPLSPALSRTA